MNKLLLLVWGMFSAAVQAETITGKVIGIADGDTLTMLVADTPVKIRVAGIDAPEKTQDFGQKAKQSLSDLAFNQVVTADCRKKDKYQRNVCVVFADGKDVGLELIRTGMAWWYRQYAREQLPIEQKEYESAELTAKAEGAGLWSMSAIPPWDWRKTEKQKKATHP